MVLSVSISAAAEANLKAKAEAVGLDVETFASRTLEHAAARPSLDEVLAPLRAEYGRCGMTEDELTDLLEEAKHESGAARRRAS